MFLNSGRKIFLLLFYRLFLRLMNAILILEIICWVYVFLLKMIKIFICWNKQGWVKLLSKVFIIIWILILKVWIVIRINFVVWNIHLKLIIITILTLLFLYLFIKILQFSLICPLCEAHLFFLLIELVLELVVCNVLICIYPFLSTLI